MSDDEVTGVRDLPFNVKPFAIGILERYKALSQEVREMKPKLDDVHSDMQAIRKMVRVIAWALGFLVALSGAHLIWVHH